MFIAAKFNEIDLPEYECFYNPIKPDLEQVSLFEAKILLSL